jgi:hypothetical protein
MTREDKLRMLLHPEAYTDEQMDRMLDLEDVGTPDANEEWERLKQERLSGGSHQDEAAGSSPTATANVSRLRLHTTLSKVAAVFVGILMISGIAYAAVHFLSSRSDVAQKTETVAKESKQAAISTQESVEADSTARKTVVFEDKELSAILWEIGEFYECEVVYGSEKVKHVRLYFTWDKTKSLDDLVETFNKFERFHITREKQLLIVE